MPRKELTFLLLCLGIGFSFHFLWEFLQCSRFFIHENSAPTVPSMVYATLGDILLTFVLYIVVMISKKSPTWVWENWTLITLFQIEFPAIIIAILVEHFSLKTNRWQYTIANPLVPYIEVSWLPILQMALITPLIFFLSKTIYLHFANTKTNRSNYEN